MKFNLIESPILKSLLMMSWSMSWGLFAVIGFNLADTYYIAQLGEIELASVSLCYPIVLIFFSLALGISTAVSSLVSRSIGSGNKNQAIRYTSDALMLSLIIVVLSILVGFTFLDGALSMLGASELTKPIATEYLTIWFYGMFFLTIPMVGNGAIRANGDMKVASLIMIVGAIVNVILDPLLIFGWNWIPAMGVKGAAIATVIARSITLFASLFVLKYKYKLLEFKTPKINDVTEAWKKILHLGIPAAGTNLLAPIGVTVVTAIIARMGEDYLAAYGVVNKVESFFYIFFLSLSAALSPIVGQSLGAGRLKRVRRVMKQSILLTIVWGAVSAVTLFYFSEDIMIVFSDNPEVIKIGKLYFILVPIAYGLYGIRIIISSFFNTIGKPIFSTSIAASYAFILFIPLVYIGNYLNGINGVFLAHCLSYLLIGFISLYLLGKYISRNWENSFE